MKTKHGWRGGGGGEGCMWLHKLREMHRACSSLEDSCHALFSEGAFTRMSERWNPQPTRASRWAKNARETRRERCRTSANVTWKVNDTQELHVTPSSNHTQHYSVFSYLHCVSIHFLEFSHSRAVTTTVSKKMVEFFFYLMKKERQLLQGEFVKK